MASESAAMAEELEKYLLRKLDDAIEQTNKEDQSLSSCLFSLHSDFKNLKAMIERKSTPLLAKDESKRRETLYHLNNLLSEWQMITKKHGIYEPVALGAAINLNESLKKIKKDLKGGESTSKKERKDGESSTSAGAPADMPQDQQETEPPPSFPQNLETYRWSSRYPPKRVHGLDDKIRFMERLLVKRDSKDGFRTMAIVGMTGVGKTALCQVMFNHEKVKSHYLLRLWVCLSRQPNDDLDFRKEVVKRILLCLGVEDDVIDLAGKDAVEGLGRLIFALRLQLLGKKYLIVLDDASKEDKCFENLSSDESSKDDCYEKLAYGLPKGEGSMVIVTTRSEEIAKKMVGEENVHHLPLLKKKELCWDIFKDTVEKDGIKLPKEYESLQDLVVKRCAGLPLSATMMGEIMRQTVKAEQSAQSAAAHQHPQPGHLVRQHTV